MGLQVNINGANQNWGKGLAAETPWADAPEGDRSVQNAASKLSDIANLAFGTKNQAENNDGGFGRIGLVNGHVVKFATSRTDRVFVKTTQAMRESCNALRTTLFRLAEDYLRGIGAKLGPDESFKAEQEKALDEIRTKLGVKVAVNGDVSIKKGVGLLDRKVVASVINRLSGLYDRVDDALSDRMNDANGTYLELEESKRFDPFDSVVGKARVAADASINDFVGLVGTNITKPPVNSQVTGVSIVEKATTEAKTSEVEDRTNEEVKGENENVDEVKGSDAVEIKTPEQMKLEDFVGQLRSNAKIKNQDNQDVHDNPFCSNAYDVDDIEGFLPKTFALFARAENEDAKNAVLKELMAKMHDVFENMGRPRDILVKNFAEEVENRMLNV